MQPHNARGILFVSIQEAGTDGDLPPVFGLFTVDVDTGARKPLIEETSYALDPVWSPDRVEVAFTAFTGAVRDRNDVYHVRADGSAVSRVTSNPRHMICSSPTWSPDGSRIAFSGLQLDRSGTGTDEPGRLFVTELRTGKTELIGEGVCPDWSPDGQRILFTKQMVGFLSEGHLYTMQPDGAKIRRLVDRKTTMGASWSPGGRFIAYSEVDGDERGSIWVAKADGSSRRRLTQHAQPPGREAELWADVTDREPQWSDNGEYIVFSRWLEVSPWGVPVKAGIHRIDATGQNLRRLSPEDSSEFWRGGTALAPFLLGR